jgi:tetrahydromethanopterin S-methyltransferase subunit B
MWTDPIVDEIRKVREEHAARFSYDLQAIYEDIKELERASGRTFVTLPPKKPTMVPAPPETVTRNGQPGEKPETS